MAFVKGKSGNPSGRPRGAVSNPLTKILRGSGPDLVNRAIEMAMEGDSAVMNQLLNRLSPTHKTSHDLINLCSMDEYREMTPQERIDLIAAGAMSGLVPADVAQALAQTVGVAAAANEWASLSAMIEKAKELQR